MTLFGVFWQLYAQGFQPYRRSGTILLELAQGLAIFFLIASLPPREAFWQLLQERHARAMESGHSVILLINVVIYGLKSSHNWPDHVASLPHRPIRAG